MKKKIFYLCICVFIIFILPILLTKQISKETLATKNEEEQIVENQNTEISNNENNYEYKNYGKIKLLHSKTGEVEELSIDEYLKNVVSAEMPADFELEALKAQAVVARTYTIYKARDKKHENADICDDSNCCQAWISKEDRLAKWEEDVRKSNWQKICDCVDQTKGMVITYDNQVINAFFHSNSGGTTETPINVWGGSYPYLQTVQTDGEEGYHQYASEVTYTNEELINILKGKYNDIQIDFSNDSEIQIMEHTESGRVKTIKFGNHNLSGVEARTLLKLKSTNFEIKKENNSITFYVKGYGHGVGMSQTGANTMAQNGSNYQDIIKHFYTGVEITDVNSL